MVGVEYRVFVTFLEPKSNQKTSGHLRLCPEPRNALKDNGFKYKLGGDFSCRTRVPPQRFKGYRGKYKFVGRFLIKES